MGKGRKDFVLGNREKIILAAKDLFNEHGAANVGTNRIAAHLGISPGNLYYHFKNKEEIIRAIFPEINLATEQALAIQQKELPPEAQLVNILKSWMSVVWDYRFFYGNMVQLLRNDPELQSLYVARRKLTLAFLKSAFLEASKQRHDGAPKLTQKDAEMLSTNVWIIALNWIRFLQVEKSDDEISQEEITSGAFQVFAIITPYLDAETRQAMEDELRKQL